jgi:hypothetical protein
MKHQLSAFTLLIVLCLVTTSWTPGATQTQAQEQENSDTEIQQPPTPPGGKPERPRPGQPDVAFEWQDPAVPEANPRSNASASDVTLHSALTPRTGVIAFSDDFSDPESGWYEGATSDLTYGYANGEYRITIGRSGWAQGVWNETYLTVDDFTMEVDYRIVSARGRGGIFFGTDFSLEDSVYLFAISDEGTYALYDGVRAVSQFVIPWTPSAAIHTDGRTNRLRVVRQGYQLDLYVNDQFLQSAPYGDPVLDPSPKTLNTLGILSGTWPDSTNMDARFDNFRIYQPQNITENANNLVQNGSFEGDGTPWNTQGQVGFSDVSATSGRLSAFAVGDGILAQNISIPIGARAATLTFQALFYSAGGSADPNDKMWLGIGTHERWCYYDIRSPGMLTTWQEITIQLDEASVRACRGQPAVLYFGFQYASNSGSVFLIDDVVLEASGTGNITEPEPDPGPEAERFIDLTISLHRPSVDANLRQAYEDIIGYFADGVYEASNGAHKLRRVTIYTNWQQRNRADVWWWYDQMTDHENKTVPCWPTAYVSGVTDSTHVNMCDIIRTDQGPTDYLQFRELAGYTLAHEWGHYYYGLYDEYQGTKSKYNQYPGMPHTTDTPVDGAIMNGQWRAINEGYRWLNFSTSLNNRGGNAQYRMHGASAWDTLVRHSSNDPAGLYRPRQYYPELRSVAPGAGQTPRIDLRAGHTARSALQICWNGQCSNPGVAQQSATSVTQILIDASAGMASGNRLAQAQNAARWYVDQAEIGEAIGVLAFDGSVTTVQPITIIDSETTRTAIKNQIDAIQPGTAQTTMGDGMAEALDTLAAFYGDAANITNGHVILLVGNSTTTGRLPYSVIPTYQDAGVPLYVVDYGNTPADALLLGELADSTRGWYYSIQAADVSGSGATTALSSAEQSTSLTSQVDIDAGYGVIDPAQTETATWYADTTLTSMEVQVTYESQGAVDLELVNPMGASAGLPDCTNSGTASSCVFEIDAATFASGDWTLNVTTNSAQATVWYRVTGISEGQVTFGVALQSAQGDVIQYPEPLVVVATINQGLPITDAEIEAVYFTPDGQSNPLILRDDGVDPDRLAGDGTYTGFIHYLQEGEFGVTARFTNDNDTAAFTYIGLGMAPGDEDATIPSEPGKVGENFVRIQQTQVRVVGLRDDDHGETARDATHLFTGETPVAGRIDAAGDKDLFHVIAPEDGTLRIQINSLLNGMEPQVRLLASDGLTVVETATAQDETLELSQSVRAGDTFYIEVAHQDRTATQGNYVINAGVPPANSAGGAVFLPFIKR